MKRRRVRFTTTACDQLRAAKVWWIENNRPVVVLADEVERAIAFLEWLPWCGIAIRQSWRCGLEENLS
jgi:hypothetical protein